ncbi:EamA family transporter [Aurantimonas sp. MSK8Z-1]|uniref:DMT family transporter n=1 Tax=Mangrovibrevibacter kandeliae TaxID=2968473 RepID=UPI00211769FD|nr:EamA family transporter [Aurantimonas sp. MSK8Z-1]MCW4116662.1 EamA family transporter [Aurantimonas sp. MSK8Z-1]
MTDPIPPPASSVAIARPPAGPSAPGVSVDAAPTAAAALTPRLWGVLMLLGLLWGGSFFFNRVALAELAPLPLVACRIGLAALLLVGWLSLRGVSLRPIAERAPAFVLLGLLNNALPFTLIGIGQTEVGSGLASVINATTPLWTILVATAFTSDDRITPNRLIGILFGIAGVAVLIGPNAVGLGVTVPIWAMGCILGATLSYAFAGVFARRLRGIAAPVVAAGQLCGGCVVLGPATLALYAPATGLALPSAPVVAAVCGLAVLSTCLAYILYFLLIARAGATNASLVTFIIPASAILLGVLFLDESLTLPEIAGLGLILLGLLAVDGRLLRLKGSPFARTS